MKNDKHEIHKIIHNTLFFIIVFFLKKIKNEEDVYTCLMS